MLRILKSTLPVYICAQLLAAFLGAGFYSHPWAQLVLLFFGLSYWVFRRRLKPHLNSSLVFMALIFGAHSETTTPQSTVSEHRVPLELQGRVQAIRPRGSEMSTLVLHQNTVMIRPLQEQEFSAITFQPRLSLPNKRVERLAPNDQVSIQGWMEPLGNGGLVFRCDLPLQFRHSRTRASLSDFFSSCRRQFIALLEARLTPQSADLVVGITTGIKPSRPENIRPLQESGVAHFFAVSGIHLAILAFALRALLPLILPHKQSAAVVLFVALLGFALFVGHRPSVLRALAFLTATILSRHLGRPLSAGWSLLTIAALFLLVQPQLAKDAGFLLTLSALVGIIWIGFPLARGEKENQIQAWLKRKRGRIRRATDLAVASCSVSYGATCATLPITAFTFGSLAPLSIFATPLLSPAVAGLLIGGLLLPFCDLHAPLVDFLAGALVTVAGVLAQIPGTYFDNLEPRLEALVVYYLCLACAVIAGARRSSRQRSNALPEETKSGDRYLFLAPILGFALLLGTAQSRGESGPQFYESRGLWNWTLSGDTQKFLVSNRGATPRFDTVAQESKKSRANRIALRVIRRRQVGGIGPPLAPVETIEVANGTRLSIWRVWSTDRNLVHTALLLKSQGLVALDLQGFDTLSLRSWIHSTKNDLGPIDELFVPPNINDADAAKWLRRIQPRKIRLSQQAIRSNRYDSWLSAAAELLIEIS